MIKKYKFEFILIWVLFGLLFGERPAKPDTLPDKTLTPGKTLDVTQLDICVPLYTEKVRNVSKLTKRKVFSLYHTSPTSDAYEIDHLISLSLGGSNSIENLWPQSYTDSKWNAHDKDKLENRLRRLVCYGAIPLEQAQEDISKDWIAAYKKYIGEKK